MNCFYMIISWRPFNRREVMAMYVENSPSVGSSTVTPIHLFRLPSALINLELDAIIEQFCSKTLIWNLRSEMPSLRTTSLLSGKVIQHSIYFWQNQCQIRPLIRLYIQSIMLFLAFTFIFFSISYCSFDVNAILYWFKYTITSMMGWGNLAFEGWPQHYTLNLLLANPCDAESP